MYLGRPSSSPSDIFVSSIFGQVFDQIKQLYHMWITNHDIVIPKHFSRGQKPRHRDSKVEKPPHRDCKTKKPWHRFSAEFWPLYPLINKSDETAHRQRIFRASAPVFLAKRHFHVSMKLVLSSIFIWNISVVFNHVSFI